MARRGEKRGARQPWVVEELFSLDQAPVEVLRQRYRQLFGAPAGALDPRELIQHLAAHLRRRLVVRPPTTAGPTLVGLLLARVRSGRVSVLYLSPPRSAA
ncbi:MAG: hypothetical protein IT371_11265 [Deltaproteobacteria bacterium]|nr:hypothetical protein [Deltaproteobacteria bacterium]